MGIKEKCDGGARDDELELTKCVPGECMETRTGHGGGGDEWSDGWPALRPHVTSIARFEIEYWSLVLTVSRPRQHGCAQSNPKFKYLSRGDSGK